MTTENKLLKLRKLADAMYYAAQYLTTDASRLHKAMDEYHKFIIHECKEEPVSEGLEEAAFDYAEVCKYDGGEKLLCVEHFKDGANWQKEQDKETIELAEDHAYFAGRTKTIEEIEEKLLSEVLPCFMHGGEADEVVAKLDEVLNQK